MPSACGSNEVILIGESTLPIGLLGIIYLIQNLFIKYNWPQTSVGQLTVYLHAFTNCEPASSNDDWSS